MYSIARCGSEVLLSYGDIYIYIDIYPRMVYITCLRIHAIIEPARHHSLPQHFMFAGTTVAVHFFLFEHHKFEMRGVISVASRLASWPMSWIQAMRPGPHLFQPRTADAIHHLPLISHQMPFSTSIKAEIHSEYSLQ